jgi:hypothetical protein
VSRYQEWRAETAAGEPWSREELAALQKLLTKIQATLGLRDAHVELLGHKGVPGASEDARSFVFSESDHIEIRLGHDFRDETPTQQVHVLVHEVLHVHFEPVIDFAANALDGEIGRLTTEPLQRAWNRFAERQIDRLAMGLTSVFPAIDWPVSPELDTEASDR